MADLNVVLAVDDNTEILQLMRNILSKHGFRVQIAKDGAEGLECFHTHRHELCLVITDVVMPEMNGLELARAIRAVDGELPVLLISGYATPQIEGESHFPFLRKPFLPTDLLKAVHSVVRK